MTDIAAGFGIDLSSFIANADKADKKLQDMVKHSAQLQENLNKAFSSSGSGAFNDIIGRLYKDLSGLGNKKISPNIDTKKFDEFAGILDRVVTTLNVMQQLGLTIFDSQAIYAESNAFLKLNDDLSKVLNKIDTLKSAWKSLSDWRNAADRDNIVANASAITGVQFPKTPTGRDVGDNTKAAKQWEEAVRTRLEAMMRVSIEEQAKASKSLQWASMTESQKTEYIEKELQKRLTSEQKHISEVQKEYKKLLADQLDIQNKLGKYDKANLGEEDAKARAEFERQFVERDARRRELEEQYGSFLVSIAEDAQRKILDLELKRIKDRKAAEEAEWQSYLKTPEGALTLANDAKSINDMKEAQKYLVEARNATDVKDINTIDELNKAYQKLRVTIEQLTTAEKNENTLQPTVRNEYARLLKELDKLTAAKERAAKTEAFKSGDANAQKQYNDILSREKDVRNKIIEIEKAAQGQLDETKRKYLAERAQIEIAETERLESEKAEIARRKFREIWEERKKTASISGGKAEQIIEDASNSKNILDEKAAVESLKEARDRLNTSDGQNAEILDRLNAEIEEHEKNIKRATDATFRKKEAEEEVRKAMLDPNKAIEYSKNEVRSINDRIKALQYLKDARDNLNSSVEGYEDKIKELTDEYDRQQEEINRLKGKQDELGKSQSRLVNIADQLTRRLAAVFSVQSIIGYANKVIEVTGEFELQHRAMQAIIQDSDEANKLWEKTVNLAVKSPFRVKDLVTYTKQLAAYRIETTKLYDKTKMLADISAGLGVDMNRLILAYGQVKAANYLRGTELRQFSEAGINILKELSEYFSEIEGRAVSVGQVFERISKRMVTFKDVDTVLKRVTQAGGMFYQMQEKQSETLKGQLMNLKDSIDLMLNDIGEKNNEIILSIIETIKLLVDNWEKAASVIKIVATFLALYKLSLMSVNAEYIKLAVELGVTNAQLGKQLTLTQLLSIGWKKLTGAVGKSSKSLASFATKGGAVLAIIVAGIALFAKLFKTAKEYNKVLDDINKKAVENKKQIQEISVKFKANVDKNDLKNARAEFARLQAMAKKDFNLEYVFDPQKMSLSELQKAYANIRKDMEKTASFSRLFAWNMQKASQWKISDNIWEDAQQFSQEFKKTEAYTLNSRDSVIDYFNQNAEAYNKLTEEQKKALDVLKGEKEKNESDVEYILRLADAYLVLESALKSTHTTLSGTTSFGGVLYTNTDTYQADAKDALKSSRTLLDKQKELESEYAAFKEIVGHGATIAELKTAIDDLAEAGMIDYITKQFFYMKEGIKEVDDSIEDFIEEDADAENILNNKISLIKNLREEYLRLNQTFGAEDSKNRVKDSFAAALSEAGLDINQIDFTSETGLIQSLKRLEPEANAAGIKAKIALQKAIGEVQVEIDIKSTKDANEKLNREIEDMFGRYDVSMEMEKLDIPPELAQRLFDFTPTSLDEIRDKVQSEINKIEITGGQEEKLKAMKEYLEKVDKLERDALEDRMKEYIKYLRNEQNERIKFKMEELRKLADIDKLQKAGTISSVEARQMRENVQKETQQNVEKSRWEEFERSSTYVNMFEDTTLSTTDALQAMKTRLEEIKRSMIAAGLPASDLKEVLNQIAKVEDELDDRKLFGGIGEDIKNTVRGYKEYLANKREETELLNAQKELGKRIAEQELLVAQEKQAGGKDNEDGDLKARLASEEASLLLLEKGSSEYEDQLLLVEALRAELYPQLAIYNQLISQQEENNNQLDETQSGIKKWRTALSDIGEKFSEIGYSVLEIGSSLTDTLVKTGAMSEDTAEIVNNLMNVGNDILGIGTNLAGVISNPASLQSWAGLLTSTISLVGNLAATSDAVKDKEIAKEAKAVEKLSKKYEELSKEMDNAYSIEQMQVTQKAMEQNLDAQIAAIEKQRAAEEDKKNTDQDAVDEYTDKINELEEKKAETQKELVEKMGGSYDYASIAEQFVDAWLDAFEETGDGLKGLEDNFKEFFKDIVKKQIIYGGVTKIIQPLMTLINSDLGDNQRIDDWTAILKEYDKAEENINTYMKDALDKLKDLGLDNIFSGESELSGLSAGISGITEEQAGILEAYWNAVRFDVSAIRQRFDEYLATQGLSEDANPMLTVLNSQLEQLKAIRGVLDDAITGGDSTAGAFRVRVVEMK